MSAVPGSLPGAGASAGGASAGGASAGGASAGGNLAHGAGLTPEAAYWDVRYREAGKVWGDGPSELARLAVARLSFAAGRGFGLLDVGCGYGRDSIFLAAELGCRVVGIDPSPAAVSAARRGRRGDLDVEFEAADPVTFGAQAAAAAGVAAEDETVAAVEDEAVAGEVTTAAFDVVFVSGVYHLLPLPRRRDFAAALPALVRPGGLLFLSTLSPRDPQHYAKGRPVEGEERSWFGHCYLHFCTADELADDFAGLELLDLEERSYDERLADGRVHHHTSWFLEARRPAEGDGQPANGSTTRTVP